ncbi:ThiF family adenylyltransferase [Tenacibaculum tangerinum]|uniref:ThiF family adenylyltransferase n=1 Tax=Tenacibaculum tangerinum TaxID=3038772 RepID=A0ABY8L655_9FLAO|nr:ThiF family adenylyltransferase [Tenacibaculum tangerinum]WGH76887.1 ThiF family adenylyltransferase [Tenacibaculum tangerinum]
MRYNRNRIYLDNADQQKIKQIPILLGGAGIGSVIAECALRFGFENITIVDGDFVELTNLNRQNYIEDDIGISKVMALKKRLLNINSNAKIQTYNCFINKKNIKSIIDGHQIAINALDFTTNIPILFDQICREKQIPVLHPYNLGWGGLVVVIDSSSLPLNSIVRDKKSFNELHVVEYVSSYMKFWGKPQNWLEDIVESYKKEKETLPPPQLAVASWLVASICTNLLYKIATNKKLKIFPEFYMSTIE